MLGGGSPADFVFANEVPKGFNAGQYYNHLAGEIEARDAAARMGLTAGQRTSTSPYTSENIPLKEWIVRMGKTGTKAEVKDYVDTMRPITEWRAW